MGQIAYGRLENKVAIVTGAARGIGRELALGYAREGADIVIVDVLADLIEETKKDVEALGRKALGIVCDISDPEQCENVAKKTVETFGKIDILLNVASILSEYPFLEIPIEKWRRIVDVNLSGTYFMCRAVLPTMVEQKNGNIIFCTAGYLRQHQPRSAAYSASKAGAAMLVRVIASEFCRQGIRCNAFYPGPTLDTPGAKMSNTPPEVSAALAQSIPLGRIGAVDECVGTTVFLASEESKFITGQMIAVDGGMTMT